jgi:signal transduction histidine kinase
VARAIGSQPTVAKGVSFRRLRATAGSVRARTTAVAVVIVGVALVVAGVALVGILRSTLTESVLVGIQQRAADVTTELRKGIAPDRLMLGGSEDLLIQVLDEGGAVVAASAESGDRPLTDLEPGESSTIDVPADDDPYLAYLTRTDTPGGAYSILIARSLDIVADSSDLVGSLLIVGIPSLLLVVAVTTWLIVGRALAPVEAIRREVDEISGAQLHRRVPAPAGGDEIARLAATMNRMLDRLESAQARQRQLVADTSHELRSPIATIRQHVEVALAHPERATIADLAETVLAEDLRLGALVDDLLILARADEGTLALHVESVDLDDIVLDEARRLRTSAKVAVDTHEISAGRVVGDASALTRVVSNLAENAARHARGRVAFGLRPAAAGVRLRVDDDGPGIPAADRLRVFDRFVRLEGARSREDGGGGLGLSIVRELVDAHGGTVRITDSPLGGTRVEVVFPAAP